MTESLKSGNSVSPAFPRLSSSNKAWTFGSLGHCSLCGNESAPMELIRADRKHPIVAWTDLCTDAECTTWS